MIMSRKKPPSIFDHPLNQLSRGDVLWDEDYVGAMAEGKKMEGKIDWDKILKPVDPNMIKQDDEVKMHAKAIEKITAYEDALEKAVCPKHSNHPLKFFDDATWTSDGEDVKCYNIKCQGTESSPCSFCSQESEVKTPPPKKPKTTSEFAQAKGFNKDDFEGEEETPKKMSADACKWCQLDPCIIDDDESREEGRMIVNNLNAQEGSEMNNFRFALYRTHARQLGYVGERHILPRCVYLFIEKHFVEPGEKSTGFKPKAK